MTVKEMYDYSMDEFAKENLVLNKALGAKPKSNAEVNKYLIAKAKMRFLEISL